MGRPNGTGRPSLLQDPACAPRVDALLSAVEAGLSAAGACRASGIAQATLYDWLERAEEDDAPAYLVEFSERYARARGERERARIQVIDAAGQKDWRAAAWLLERQEPTDYGARRYIEAETTHIVKTLEITGPPLPEQEYPRGTPDLEAARTVLTAARITGLDTGGKRGTGVHCAIARGMED